MHGRVFLVQAVQLLAIGTPVTQIAFDQGFESVSGFVCSFRQSTACHQIDGQSTFLAALIWLEKTITITQTPKQ